MYRNGKCGFITWLTLFRSINNILDINKVNVVRLKQKKSFLIYHSLHTKANRIFTGIKPFQQTKTKVTRFSVQVNNSCVSIDSSTTRIHHNTNWSCYRIARSCCNHFSYCLYMVHLDLVVLTQKFPIKQWKLSGVRDRERSFAKHKHETMYLQIANYNSHSCVWFEGVFPRLPLFFF